MKYFVIQPSGMARFTEVAVENRMMRRKFVTQREGITERREWQA
jgi:hypothetical protein